MGLFGFGRKKAEMREECPPYLTGKEVRKLKQSLFSGEETPERICRMLGFAAPLLGKENQPIDALPQYRGKEEERLAAMYASSWGDPSYETLAEQVGHLVEGDQEEFLNQVNRILRAYPKSEWAGQASRLGGLDSSTLDKLERAEEILGMGGILRRLSAGPGLVGLVAGEIFADERARCTEHLPGAAEGGGKPDEPDPVQTGESLNL